MRERAIYVEAGSALMYAMIGTGSHVLRRPALMLTLVMLWGCSEYALPKEDQPAMGPPPSYRTLIANYIKLKMKNYASYDAVEVSDPLWGETIHGWTWLVCLRFRDHGHRRTYTFFIPEKAEALNDSDSRYSVMSDSCGTQVYSPLDVNNSMGALY
jgi:hypothetical protein